MPPPRLRSTFSFVVFHAALRNAAVASEVLLADPAFNAKRKKRLTPLLEELHVLIRHFEEIASGPDARSAPPAAVARGVNLRYADSFDAL